MRKTLADRLAEAIGTGLYSGHFPIFPGTVGSVVGVAIYLVLLKLDVLSEAYSSGWPVTLGAVLVIGFLSARKCEKNLGFDDKRIVIDEIWGMLIAFFLIPPTARSIIGAFVLFRFFDVVKPFPARRIEHAGRGVGVMLDDGVAGAYANITVHLVRALSG